MKIVLVGEIDSGKSTVVRAAMERLGWDRPAGFFTHWADAGRGAEVLYFETWSGRRRPMARRIAAPAVPGGLAYELDRANFTEAAVESLSEAAPGRPVVIDELGVIELGEPRFAEAVAKLFRGSAPVLAVVQRRALEPWTGIFARENIDRLLEVDAATRDALPAKIAALFRA